MKEGTDYLFFKKTTMNGMLYNGYIGKAAMVCTPSYVFCVEYENFQILNNWGESKGVDEIRWSFNPPDEIFEDMGSITEMEAFFKANLKEDNVFEVNALDKFQIQKGFLFFGSLGFKKKDRRKLVTNLQPQSNRIKMRQFYGMG